MINLVAAVHIVGALLLICVVLLQDSKDGAMGGMLGGGSSNSLLGATGATTLFEKMTRYLAIFFAFSCVLLTVLTAHQGKSLLDSYTAPAAPTAPAGSVPTTPAEQTAAPTTEAPAAAPAETPAPEKK